METIQIKETRQCENSSSHIQGRKPLAVAIVDSKNGKVRMYVCKKCLHVCVSKGMVASDLPLITVEI